MVPSEKIKSMIKAWEGCRLKAYTCPAGVLTIGYGHTGPDVKPGMTISQARANEIFDADINRFASQVETAISPARLTQNQFDAIVSIAYNIGIGALRRSTLLRLVKANPADKAIRGAFMQWVKGGGRVLPGLQRRRAQEADHYFLNS